ncbi:MAG: electron transfer flavoprotein subunit beta/FixA family protein [Bacteroidota bacterium]|nr:electron transfer flavoprotein subunit beta/FixA family protein [Bacteroidota bacterium]
MNIFVCISHVPDTTTKIIIGQDGKSIDRTEVTYILNPYDEFAIEAGLQWKESKGGEVTAVCVGSPEVKETIRKAFAMGVDKGIHIVTDSPFDSYGTARALADTLRERRPDVVFCGRQSIDYDGWQVPGMLAELLGMPAVTVVSSLELREDGTFTAERDIEGGKETIVSRLPALISAQKGLNNPRYPKLQGIMAAKKKPIEDVPAVQTPPRVRVLEMFKPPLKSGGRIVGEGAGAVPELVRLLHEEAKVI